MRQTKIATCCYCGTRAALVLAGEGSHELACSACGAPLHNLKMLPKSRDTSHRDLVKPSALPGRQDHRSASPAKPPKPKKQKKKKSFKRRLMGEIFDIIEDIID
ncbi:MAG: hypothetical protein AAGF78_10550 [Pseudomonadota bacterium]